MLHTFLHPIIVFWILSCSFTPHIHLTILISARWSATSFSFFTGQVSKLPWNILLRIQLLYNLPLTFNDTSVVPAAWIYSIQFGFCSPLQHQHLHLHSACHLNNKTYPLTPDLHWHHPVPVTGFMQPLQTNVFITLYMLPLYHYISCVPTSDN